MNTSELHIAESSLEIIPTPSEKCVSGHVLRGSPAIEFMRAHLSTGAVLVLLVATVATTNTVGVSYFLKPLIGLLG